MKIILTENIKGLGQIGETAEVKRGYARNFLVPRRLAVPATAVNLKKVGELKEKKALEVKKELEKTKEIADRLKDSKFIIETRTDEKGNLYAAIDSLRIKEALKEKGIEVGPDYILLNEPIKKAGVHPVLFKYYDIEAPFEIEVLSERRSRPR